MRMNLKLVCLYLISVSYLSVIVISSNVYTMKEKIVNSKVLPANLLPNFLFSQGKVEAGASVKTGGGRGTMQPFIPDDSVSDDIFQDAMTDMRSPQLPYLTQDLWGCERADDEIDVYVLENEYLKVTITPQYGGKIQSMYDKKLQKEMLYNNKVHQPANIGTLHAWVAGGIEFNWSPGIIGHSVFGESNVYMSVVMTERGNMIRVYDYDRYNSTIWQVDILLSNNTLLVHPRVTNPTDVDLRGYWWTCVAVPTYEDTRVYSPASNVVDTSRLVAGYANWPNFFVAIENASFVGHNGQGLNDNSYIYNHPSSGDYFLRINKDEVYTPYIASSHGDGDVLVHGHKLNGTKFWNWGNSGPSRFMQDFLAAGIKGVGAYTELQVGPAPTQMQTWSLPKKSIKQWTEWFKAYSGDVDRLSNANYKVALESIDEWIQSPGEGMTNEEFADWEIFFNKYASVDADKVLESGSVWGLLEEIRLGYKLAPGIEFAMPASDTLAYNEALPWLELLDSGTFSDVSLSRLPLSYQTTDAWLALLYKSVETFGMTWLHALHIGICLTERGAVSESIAYFETSIELLPTPIAYRCIALLSASTDVWSYYQLSIESLSNAAVAFAGDVNADAIDRLTQNLYSEIAIYLAQQSSASWMDISRDFLNNLPSNLIEIDSILRLQVTVSNYDKNYDASLSILSKHCFPTYATDRVYLMSLWTAAVEGNCGSTIELDKHRCRVANPIPQNIGCSKGSKYCLNYW